jgi:hypothetical protein
MKHRTGALALLAMLCLPVSANADTMTQTLTTPALATTAFTAGNFLTIDLLTNPFNQFDPSLGTLNFMTATISGSVVFTNVASSELFVEFLTPTSVGNFQLQSSLDFLAAAGTHTESVAFNNGSLPASFTLSYGDGHHPT